MKVVCFVIHLEQATQRRANAETIARLAPIDAKLQLAVDGSKLSGEEISRVYSRHLHKPYYPFALNHGEIGIFLSNLACWKRIVDERADAGLILEDDLQLNPDMFTHAFHLACQYVHQLGYIQFAIRRPRGEFRVICNHNSTPQEQMSLMTPRTAPLGACAQIVSRSTAKRLYRACQRFDRPVDTFIQMYWLTSQPVHTIYPSGVSHIGPLLGGSTIQQKTGRQRWLYREWNRLSYRTKIRFLSRKFRKLSRGHQDASVPAICKDR